MDLNERIAGYRQQQLNDERAAELQVESVNRYQTDILEFIGQVGQKIRALGIAPEHFVLAERQKARFSNKYLTKNAPIDSGWRLYTQEFFEGYYDVGDRQGQILYLKEDNSINLLLHGYNDIEIIKDISMLTVLINHDDSYRRERQLNSFIRTPDDAKKCFDKSVESLDPQLKKYFL